MPDSSPARARVFSSSVGTKLLIGITGLALFGYLIVHIAGNLVVFMGPAAYNKYAFTLEDNALLPVVELGLLLIFLVHIYKTISNFLANQQARPVRYVRKKQAGSPSRKNFASTTMIVTGLWLLAFLIIHVRTFRAGWGTEYPWALGGRDLYRQEIEAFANPLVVAFYVLSMLVVGSHLWHGITSSLQSLGLDASEWSPRILVAGKLIAAAIAGAFIVIALWAHFAAGAS